MTGRPGWRGWLWESVLVACLLWSALIGVLVFVAILNMAQNSSPGGP